MRVLVARQGQEPSARSGVHEGGDEEDGVFVLVLFDVVGEEVDVLPGRVDAVGQSESAAGDKTSCGKRPAEGAAEASSICVRETGRGNTRRKMGKDDSSTTSTSPDDACKNRGPFTSLRTDDDDAEEELLVHS